MNFIYVGDFFFPWYFLIVHFLIFVILLSYFSFSFKEVLHL